MGSDKGDRDNSDAVISHSAAAGVHPLPQHVAARSDTTTAAVMPNAVASRLPSSSNTTNANSTTPKNTSSATQSFVPRSMSFIRQNSNNYSRMNYPPQQHQQQQQQQQHANSPLPQQRYPPAAVMSPTPHHATPSNKPPPIFIVTNQKFPMNTVGVSPGSGTSSNAVTSATSSSSIASPPIPNANTPTTTTTTKSYMAKRKRSNSKKDASPPSSAGTPTSATKKRRPRRSKLSKEEEEKLNTAAALVRMSTTVPGVVLKIKPSRRLKTGWSTILPDQLCSSPYKYIIDFIFPRSVCPTYQTDKGLDIYLTVYETGLRFENGVEADLHRTEESTNGMVKQVYLTKFLITSFKNHNKRFVLNVSNLYTSTPFRLVARKQKSQNDFWDRQLRTEDEEKGKEALLSTPTPLAHVTATATKERPLQERYSFEEEPEKACAAQLVSLLGVKKRKRAEELDRLSVKVYDGPAKKKRKMRRLLKLGRKESLPDTWEGDFTKVTEENKKKKRKKGKGQRDQSGNESSDANGSGNDTRMDEQRGISQHPNGNAPVATPASRATTSTTTTQQTPTTERTTPDEKEAPHADEDDDEELQIDDSMRDEDTEPQTVTPLAAKRNGIKLG